MIATRLKNFLSVIFVFACLVFSTALHAEEAGCAIVYGKDWAFLFAAPNNWKVECSVNNASGVVVALWPDGTPWTKAPGVMYVTVSDKDGFSLEQFAEDELMRFRKQSPKLQVQITDPILLHNKSRALVRKLTGDEYGNHEIIAYADSGTAFLIIVLTSRTQKDFERLLPAFSEFVSSVTPMKIKFGDSVKTGLQ